MLWIELHIFDSKSPILVNVEAISRIGSLGRAPSSVPKNVFPGLREHGFIRQIDGTSVETEETYDLLRQYISHTQKWPLTFGLTGEQANEG
jgi:hypothetical protein